MKKLTKKELLKKLQGLGDLPEETRNLVTCSLIGHSRIQDACFGQFTCARCRDLLGDSLMGCYDSRDVVIIGHNCETCRENYKKTTWRDRLFIADPFPEQP